MTHNTITKSPEGQLIRENNKNTEIKKYEYSLKRSLIKRTPEEHLIRENEILSKTVLEILLRFSKKQFSGSQKTDEEITELLSQPDWREKAQFEVGDYQCKEEGEVSECIGHFISCPWLISAREPIEIIENLKNEKTKKEQDQETLINAYQDIIVEKDTKIEELTVFKEQIENLEQNVVEILTKVKEKEDQEITYWEKGEPQELLTNIKKGNLVQTVVRVIKKIKRDVKTHYEALGTSEIWNKNQKTELTKEVKEKSQMLQKSGKRLAEEISKNEELREESEEKSKMLAKNEKKFDEEREELKRQLYLERKPLPSLPKKQNKFRHLGKKIKTKFQCLIEKESKKQEFVAKIEVPTR